MDHQCNQTDKPRKFSGARICDPQRVKQPNVSDVGQNFSHPATSGALRLTEPRSPGCGFATMFTSVAQFL